MKITMPSLKSLVWPVIVALSLAGLFYMTITLKAENIKLASDLQTLKTSVDASQKANNSNTSLYEANTKANQQLIKDAGRSQLLFKKPTLIERQINNSFDLYMQDFDK